MAGWSLLLSQRFLIMFTKVCDVFSTKLSVKLFGELLAKLGLDALDKRVFDQCVSHKSPDGDLDGGILRAPRSSDASDGRGRQREICAYRAHAAPKH